MRPVYTIKTESEGIVKTIATETTKRAIESIFNRLMRSYKKNEDFLVEEIRLGYSKITFFGTFGQFETEYWIERA